MATQTKKHARSTVKDSHEHADKGRPSRFTYWDGYFLNPEMVEKAQAKLNEYILASETYESFRQTALIMRRSGRYDHHTEQSPGTAHAAVHTGLYDAIRAFLDAQNGFGLILGQIEEALAGRCFNQALDSVRRRPLTNALMAALEGSWARGESEMVPPRDERRETIADAAIALAVLRSIADADAAADTPERRRERAAISESFDRARIRPAK
jgi:hypothetical protein